MDAVEHFEVNFDLPESAATAVAAGSSSKMLGDLQEELCFILLFLPEDPDVKAPKGEVDVFEQWCDVEDGYLHKLLVVSGNQKNP